MTIQAALKAASDHHCFARPSGCRTYTFTYVEHGAQRLLHIYGMDGRGRLRGDFWRTISQREMEADWILCDQHGDEIDPIKPKQLTLSEFALEVHAREASLRKVS